MTISSPVSPEAERRLRSELKLTEPLIWSGKPITAPAQRRILGSQVAIALFIAILCTACIVSLYNFAEDLHPPMLFFVYFEALVLIPLIYCLVEWLSEPSWIRRQAEWTVYAITDRRALIMSPVRYGGISFRSITAQDMGERTLTQNPDGSGTLLFTRLTTSRQGGGFMSGVRTITVTVGFRNIADVRDVDALIERAYSVSEKR